MEIGGRMLNVKDYFNQLRMQDNKGIRKMPPPITKDHYFELRELEIMIARIKHGVEQKKDEP